MTRKLQILRGTTAQNNAYTGAVGELTMDTDRNEVRIHDGQTVGGIKISDRNMPILTSMFFDHITNDMSWLRADTFSWQSGDVYKVAYEHLAADLGDSVYYIESSTTNPGHKFVRAPEQDDNSTEHPFAWYDKLNNTYIYTNNETPTIGETIYLEHTGSLDGGTVAVYGQTYSDASEQTETIGGTTIAYYLAEDGHKICLPDQESNLVALYEATGVAWYYLLDTENKQFKLPRTKYGFVGMRDGVGNYVPESLPNIVGAFDAKSNSGAVSGAFVSSTLIDNVRGYNGDASTYRFFFNASGSSSTYKDGAPVQERATQMYLYFYVGNFEQSAIEQTAGITAETLNGKVDLPTGKAQSDVDFVVESQLPTEDNGRTWYRKYKSGWVEQGGRCTVPATNGISASNVTVTLPVPIAAPEQASLTYNGLGGSANFATCEDQAGLTQTTVTIGRWNNGQAAASARNYVWVLAGQAQ